jgi:hypothetical protein
MFKNSAPTSQRPNINTIIKISHLLLLREIIPYCFKSDKKRINQEAAVAENVHMSQ